MSIYPAKNRQGQLTGKWTVEVDVPGHGRKRPVFDTHPEAKEWEAKMLAGILPPSKRGGTVQASESNVYTVGKLRQEAKVVWLGTKDETQSLARFNAVCDFLKDETAVASIRTRPDLDNLVVELRGRGLTNSTIHRYLSALSGALTWAQDRDIIFGKPKIPWPTCTKKKKTPLDADDETRMLEWFNANGHQTVALLYEVMLTCGCRIGELVGPSNEADSPLLPHHINVKLGEITFEDTKNGDTRTVPLPIDLCKRLLVEVKEKTLPGYRAVNWACKKAAGVLQISYSVTPHVMRHTAGTRMDEAGVGSGVIGAVLGHRSPVTTAGYINPQRKAMQEAVKAISKHPSST
jgi:integrase